MSAPGKVLWTQRGVAYRILHQGKGKGLSPSSPLIVLAHATGFCKEVWWPMVKELLNSGVEEIQSSKIVALDTTFHGDTKRPFHVPFDLDEAGEDVHSVIEDILATNDSGREKYIIGIGHSAGSGSLVLCEDLYPGTFDELVLMEPIAPPRKGRDENSYLGKIALKRRSSFKSRKEAYDNFLGKGAFKHWTHDSLEIYVNHALRYNAENDTYELKCEPEAGSELYKAHMRTYSALQTIRSKCHILVGETSVTCSFDPNKSTEQWCRERFDGTTNPGTFSVLPNVSHFLVMENPPLVADHVLKALGFTLSQSQEKSSSPTPRL